LKEDESEFELSVEAKALLRALLVVEPERRPTAAQALAHPWFAKEEGKG